MEKIKVYKLKLHGSTIYDQTINNILGMLECEIEELQEGTLDIKISFVMMTQEEYEALPEFDGY